MNENQINLNEKERFILNSIPTTELASQGLLTYKVKEGFGFLVALSAFIMESQELSADFFNEYTLTLGRSSQGVIQFRNAMQAMTDKSKLLSTKPCDDNDKKTQVSSMYNSLGQLIDKAMQSYNIVQQEINRDEGAIF